MYSSDVVISVSPDGHHRGMENFGSDVLLVVNMSSSSPVLVNLPKIISPSFFPYMTTSDVPILMMSSFVVLSVPVDISSLCLLPDWSASVTE
jgi:hypothetical protein